MANKTIREFSAPSIANVATSPTIFNGDVDFELKLVLIMMVQASPFSDANAYLRHFLKICGTFTVKGVTQEAIHFHLFLFSLLGKVKQQFYTNHEAVNTWEKCSSMFLIKFLPMRKTNALHNKISIFQQLADKSIPKAWEWLQEYILVCPHHGMKDWLLIQNFYHGLTPLVQDHLDAAAGRALFSLNVNEAKALIENMVSIQGWTDERLQRRSACYQRSWRACSQDGCWR